MGCDVWVVSRALFFGVASLIRSVGIEILPRDKERRCFVPAKLRRNKVALVALMRKLAELANLVLKNPQLTITH